MKGRKAIEGALKRLRYRPQIVALSKNVHLLLEDSQEPNHSQQSASWENWSMDSWHDHWTDGLSKTK
jgi:hypothetical protein